MTKKLFKISPHSIQNLFVTGYNVVNYLQRYGGKYREYLALFEKNRSLSREELKKIQQEKFAQFVARAMQNSSFYKKLYRDIDSTFTLDDIRSLPIISKETLRQHITEIPTIASPEAIHSKTGGTTGKSLEVLFTPDDMQERFAMLDDFRGRFGYELGKKTAWFSGKDLLTNRDLKKNRFWKTDFLHKVRYYSTFHIKEDYLKYYVEDLMRYSPEYLVGFPSSILEIAKYGIKNNYDFPEGVVKAIFPTAETITDEMREYIEPFFKAKMYNQYASSEGAPFIFECEKGNLHLELQSGVFEVLDENDNPAQSGRLVVTSFTTHGTPLIRYDIGDSIKLEDEMKTCTCGNNNPLVKEILGRIDDFVYSPENGKINLGNVSNTLKDTQGILKFQAIQNELNKIELLVIVDKSIYNKKIEEKFIQNWRDRIGNKMELSINYVDDIETEKSGKFRIVKNNVKEMI